MRTAIIIPAFDAADTIGETLRSIAEQTQPVSEVLIGVDKCQQTLGMVHGAIPEELRRKTSVYWFAQHPGCYRIRNTLAIETTADVLVFFDADDVMCRDHLGLITRDVAPGTAVRPLNAMQNPYGIFDRYQQAHAQVAIRKPDFIAHGGFEPWTCAADSEFLQRTEQFGLRWHCLQEPTFVLYHRDNSLTHHQDTGMRSQHRRNLHHFMRKRREKPVKRDSVAISLYRRVNAQEAQKIANTPPVTLVMPMPYWDDAERWRLAEFCLRWWSDNFPSWRIVLAAPQTGPDGYWKTKVVNEAIAELESDVIGMIDADVIPSAGAVNEAVTALQNYDYSTTHKWVKRLTRESTEQFMAMGIPGETEKYHQALMSGGCWFTTPEGWRKTGGMNEDISGWGGEDNDLGEKMREAGSIYRVNDDIVHLWHTPQPGRENGVRTKNLRKAHNSSKRMKPKKQAKRQRRTKRQWHGDGTFTVVNADRNA